MHQLHINSQHDVILYVLFFYPSELHILHPLAYKSPCAVCLKALLASGSVNLFVVHLKMGERGEKRNQKCRTGIEAGGKMVLLNSCEVLGEVFNYLAGKKTGLQLKVVFKRQLKKDIRIYVIIHTTQIYFLSESSHFLNPSAAEKFASFACLCSC